MAPPVKEVYIAFAIIAVMGVLGVGIVYSLLEVRAWIG